MAKEESIEVEGTILESLPNAMFRGPALLVYSRSQSGAGLAEAVRNAGEERIRYEACYSPGTDYLLGRFANWTRSAWPRPARATASTWPRGCWATRTASRRSSITPG